MSDLRENDICRWVWKEGRKPITGCYANLAVFVGGRLIDTFWHDWRNSGHVISLSDIDLTVLGNIGDCREITRWQVTYYDPADIINMSHSNNSSGPIYLRLTAEKSQKWILRRAEEKFAEANRVKESAERDIVEWADKIERIKAGDLEVYL